MTEVSCAVKKNKSIKTDTVSHRRLPITALQETLMKLMEEICDLIPKSYTEQCEDFVAKYGREIVEFLLSSAAPHTICTLLHLCIFKEQTLPGPSQMSSYVTSYHTQTSPLGPVVAS